MNKFHEVKPQFLKHEGETVLPVRSTKGSAGYDFYLKEDVFIPATKAFLNEEIYPLSLSENHLLTYLVAELNKGLNVVFNQKLTWTDVAVELDEDKYLSIVPRSSAGTKLGVSLANTEAVIDSDYIQNEKTGGNIGLCLKNLGNTDIYLKKGERIAQGKIISYHVVEDDCATASRTGGFGSSGV